MYLLFPLGDLVGPFFDGANRDMIMFLPCVHVFKCKKKKKKTKKCAEWIYGPLIRHCYVTWCILLSIALRLRSLMAHKRTPLIVSDCLAGVCPVVSGIWGSTACHRVDLRWAEYLLQLSPSPLGKRGGTTSVRRPDTSDPEDDLVRIVAKMPA